MPNNMENIGEINDALPIIKMENVDIVNDENLVLSDVNITINRGEFVYLLGKVGSGKSSIIKTLIAEFPTKKGRVTVGDFSLEKIKENQFHI
jgi:ABC-type transport system involved in cytochrome bd biosynthesis, fused ATPase and permease components